MLFTVRDVNPYFPRVCRDLPIVMRVISPVSVSISPGNSDFHNSSRFPKPCKWSRTEIRRMPASRRYIYRKNSRFGNFRGLFFSSQTDLHSCINDLPAKCTTFQVYQGIGQIAAYDARQYALQRRKLNYSCRLGKDPMAIKFSIHMQLYLPKKHSVS